MVWSARQDLREIRYNSHAIMNFQFLVQRLALAYRSPVPSQSHPTAVDTEKRRSHRDLVYITLLQLFINLACSSVFFQT
jgi:hypothetical protein